MIAGHTALPPDMRPSSPSTRSPYPCPPASVGRRPRHSWSRRATRLREAVAQMVCVFCGRGPSAPAVTCDFNVTLTRTCRAAWSQLRKGGDHCNT